MLPTLRRARCPPRLYPQSRSFASRYLLRSWSLLRPLPPAPAIGGAGGSRGALGCPRTPRAEFQSGNCAPSSRHNGKLTARHPSLPAAPASRGWGARIGGRSLAHGQVWRLGPRAVIEHSTKPPPRRLRGVTRGELVEGRPCWREVPANEARPARTENPGAGPEGAEPGLHALVPGEGRRTAPPELPAPYAPPTIARDWPRRLGMAKGHQGVGGARTAPRARSSNCGTVHRVSNVTAN
jgi:hypothetical protein